MKKGGSVDEGERFCIAEGWSFFDRWGRVFYIDEG